MMSVFEVVVDVSGDFGGVSGGTVQQPYGRQQLSKRARFACRA